MKTTTLIFLSFMSLKTFAAPSAGDLLKDSDRSRGGAIAGVMWNVQIQTEDDGDKSTRDFMVKARGADALVEATAPPRNKGEIYLFNDRTMWFLKPGLRKPVSISARQKLSGQAANGDIASTNYFKDYDATIVKTEKVGGTDMIVLSLKAKNKNVTYDQITYWVDAKTHLGMKAEFLTLEGVAFKKAVFEYKNHLNHEGHNIPFVSRMEIVDAKYQNNKSILTYASAEEKNLAASIFNINNVAR